jgi:hypothetical protein
MSLSEISSKITKEEVQTLTNKDLGKLSRLISQVLEDRRVEKQKKYDLIQAKKDIEKQGWSLQNFDLGHIDNCHKYDLSADIDEDYDDHCLLKYVDEAWFSVLSDHDFDFYLDQSKERGIDNQLYLYYKVNFILPPTGSKIDVISPSGHCGSYLIGSTHLVLESSTTMLPKEISFETWKNDPWFALVNNDNDHDNDHDHDSDEDN